MGNIINFQNARENESKRRMYIAMISVIETNIKETLDNINKCDCEQIPFTALSAFMQLSIHINDTIKDTTKKTKTE